MREFEMAINALHALLLSLILWAAFAIQFFMDETPCPLCLLQRMGMLAIASGALMNGIFGPSPRHYGLELLSAFFGGFVALRQIALHVCPGFPRFGLPFWGLSLYTWSFFVFVSSVLLIALLLLLFPRRLPPEEHKRPSFFTWIALTSTCAVAAANILWTLYSCGLGACLE